jgi:hypothetical protein
MFIYRKFLPLAWVLMFFSSGAFAAVINIDFENRTPDGWFQGFPPVVDHGFEFNGGPMGIAGWQDNTTNVLDFCASDACGGSDASPLTFNSVSNYNFDLISLDIGMLEGPDVADFTFTGYFVGGGTVSKSITITDFATTTGGSSTAVIFDGSWVDLTAVDISFVPGDGFEVSFIDNVTVSAVPVPAAVWLFGSALAGLGWVRRKKTV